MFVQDLEADSYYSRLPSVSADDVLNTSGIQSKRVVFNFLLLVSGLNK